VEVPQTGKVGLVRTQVRLDHIVEHAELRRNVDERRVKVERDRVGKRVRNLVGNGLYRVRGNADSFL
jgi:hypothetical protein